MFCWSSGRRDLLPFFSFLGCCPSDRVPLPPSHLSISSPPGRRSSGRRPPSCSSPRRTQTGAYRRRCSPLGPPCWRRRAAGSPTCSFGLRWDEGGGQDCSDLGLLYTHRSFTDGSWMDVSKDFTKAACSVLRCFRNRTS